MEAATAGDPVPGQVRKKPTGRPKGCKCNGSGVYCPVHPERYQSDEPTTLDQESRRRSITDRLREGMGGRPASGSSDSGKDQHDSPGAQAQYTSGAGDVNRENSGPSGEKKAGDPPPRTGKRKTRTNKATTAEIETVLGELLVLPAIPAKMVLHCDYCAIHFATQGPKAAHELALLSEDHPELRRVLVKLHAAVTAITWGAVLGAYVGKPMMHHLAPDPFLQAAGPILGVPPRPPKVPPHQHGPSPERQAQAQAAIDPAFQVALAGGLTEEHAHQFANGVAAAIMQGYEYDAAVAAVWDAYREFMTEAEHADAAETAEQPAAA